MSTKKTVRDQLLAQIELAQDRLRDLKGELADLSTEGRAAASAQIENIGARCGALREQIQERPEVQIGTATAVEDLSDAVDTLEADLDASGEAERDRYRSTVDRQLRAWRGRAERLRLQASLGTMDARDDLEHAVKRVTDARAAVLVELREAAHDARDVVVDLRNNVEEVLVDVRHAVERAADALTHSRD